jgi:hypothetical protein
MSAGGDSLPDQLDEAYAKLHYEMSQRMEAAIADENSLLDLAYQQGPAQVQQLLSEMQAKARAEADEIAKRLKGESGGDSDTGKPGGTADVGPGEVG